MDKTSIALFRQYYVVWNQENLESYNHLESCAVGIVDIWISEECGWWKTMGDLQKPLILHFHLDAFFCTNDRDKE